MTYRWIHLSCWLWLLWRLNLWKQLKTERSIKNIERKYFQVRWDDLTIFHHLFCEAEIIYMLLLLFLLFWMYQKISKCSDWLIVSHRQSSWKWKLVNLQTLVVGLWINIPSISTVFGFLPTAFYYLLSHVI